LIEIDFINGRRTDQVFGTSKYTNEIFNRIKGVALNKIEYPQIGTSRRVDGALKRTIYPMLVKHKVHDTTIKHITNQDLAFLLTCMDLHPSIVTCYDLIPVAYYHNYSLFWKMNLKGLQKADLIITISEFSKQEIIRLTGSPQSKINVIYPGVDLTHYFPKRDRSILEKFGISLKDPVLLFVGSEESRKNIGIVIRALARLKTIIPGIKLLKVGGSQMGGDRKSLMHLIHQLKLENDIIFTGQVAEKELPRYYNAADIFIFPSIYEGFGLPPLEAIACGCPVICTNSTSLPEVIGDAGIFINPDNTGELVTIIQEILNNKELREDLMNKGVERAKLFSWDKSAQETMVLYEKFI
jgi:glycosyltransferase involved in cell wall biosynthesis